MFKRAQAGADGHGTAACAAPAPQDGPLAAWQFVVFELSGEGYALPIRHVREVIRYTTPRRVSRDPLALGVISARDKLVPVIDVAAMLGLEVTLGEEARILLVATGETTSAGLLVDGVHEVITLRPDDIEPVPGTAHGILDSVARLDDRLIMLIDPTRLLKDVEAEPAAA